MIHKKFIVHSPWPETLLLVVANIDNHLILEEICAICYRERLEAGDRRLVICSFCYRLWSIDFLSSAMNYQL